MDALLLALVLCILPFVVWRPFLGAVLYTILAYLRPQELIGSAAAGSARLSLLVLAAMALGTALGVVARRERPRVGSAYFAFLLAFCLALLAATFSAAFPDLAMSAWLHRLQLLAGVGFTIALCDRPARLTTILCTVALSLGAVAVLSVVAPEWGPDGRLLGHGGQYKDSNDFALALVMVLPLLMFLRRSARNPFLRAALTIPIPFVIAAVVMTYSRGGALALAAVLLGWALWSRGRLVKLAIAPVLAGAFVAVAPGRWTERVGTIGNYAHDASARDRVSSWNVAVRIANARPWTGVGPGNFLATYPRYTTDERPPHVAHNTFLQVLADAGIPAATVFALLLLASLASAWRIGRTARVWQARLARKGDRARAERLAPLDYQGDGIFLALLGFAVGSQFLSRDNLDLFYLLAGAAFTLRALGRKTLASEGCVAAAEPAKARPMSLESRLTGLACASNS